MDEVAAQSQAPLRVRGSQSLLSSLQPPLVDEDLLGRIRSLLISRNERHPPRTPLPSPDLAFHPPRLTLDVQDYFGAAGNLEFILAKRLAKLATRDPRSRGIVSTRFDGSYDEAETLFQRKSSRSLTQGGLLSNQVQDDDGKVLGDMAVQEEEVHDEFDEAVKKPLPDESPLASKVRRSLRHDHNSHLRAPAHNISHHISHHISPRTPAPPVLTPALDLGHEHGDQLQSCFQGVIKDDGVDSTNIEHESPLSDDEAERLAMDASDILNEACHQREQRLEPKHENRAANNSSPARSARLSLHSLAGKYAESRPVTPERRDSIPPKILERSSSKKASSVFADPFNMGQHRHTLIVSPMHGTGEWDQPVKSLPRSPSLLSSGKVNATSEVGSSPEPEHRLRSSLHDGNTHQSTSGSSSLWSQSARGRRWINQLLYRQDEGPGYQSQLTARPGPRNRAVIRLQSSYDGHDSVSRRRSSVAPLGRDRRASRASQQTVNVGGKHACEGSDSFSKVILDLESLLKEALSIAGQAAEKDEPEPLLQDTQKAMPLQDRDQIEVRNSTGTFETTSELGEAISGESKKPSEEGLRQEYENLQNNDPGALLQPHNKRGVDFVEGENQHQQNHIFRRVRDKTPYPAKSAADSRHASIVPKNGARVASLSESHGVSGFPPSSKKDRRVVASTSGWEHDLGTKPRKSRSKAADGSRRDARDSDTLPLPSPSASHNYHDFAYPAMIQEQTTRSSSFDDRPEGVSRTPVSPKRAALPMKEQQGYVFREKLAHPKLPTKRNVKDYIKTHHQPPIQPRISSTGLRGRNLPPDEAKSVTSATDLPLGHTSESDDWTSGKFSPGIDSMGSEQYNRGQHLQPFEFTESPKKETSRRRNRDVGPHLRQISLKNRSHVSIRDPGGFNLSRTSRHQPVARDWVSSRKRFTAAVACLNTALIGLIIGIYAGEVPAIQYAIADFHHYAILGNVFFYIGLAISTLLFWPLPLLHGRKPYTIMALALLMPLQIPQAIAVSEFRSPYVVTWRVLLLLSRPLSGFVMGFANINCLTTLLDLFGASLQSGNPHQEVVNEIDVRRHGGGMGLWLGLWSWCSIGSIAVGFFIGALIAGGMNVSWGFWIILFLVIVVLIINIITPEVRRSAYRRTVAEIWSGHGRSRRVARGEIMTHLKSTGPYWWGQEVLAGFTMCKKMLGQPSFVVLSLYLAWVYAQVVMIVVLLGALTSRHYRLHPEYVGLSVFGIAVGAFLAIPFQKASFFSRARHHPPRTDSMTFQPRITWTSHLTRRVFFMVMLPLGGLGYTLASRGPPVHPVVPAILAAMIGFLSNMAIAECNGLIMETYDTSDLQPGMIGRPRKSVPAHFRKQRTNFSCFPRVAAAINVSQGFGFLIAAAATGTGGVIERRLGAQEATGVVAAVLMGLTIVLTTVLFRFKTVKVIPEPRFGTNQMQRAWTEWQPTIIGNPSGTTRRVNLLELGKQSRWTEIRRRNRLSTGFEGT